MPERKIEKAEIKAGFPGRAGCFEREGFSESGGSSKRDGSSGKKGFFERAYDIVRQIPRGKVATYGQIAAMLGEPVKARIVGWALHSNPYEGQVPCHRVVNRNGELSGSFAFGGADVQKRLLMEEGVEFDEEGKVDLKRFLW